jgi:uncharacterized protein
LRLDIKRFVVRHHALCNGQHSAKLHLDIASSHAQLRQTLTKALDDRGLSFHQWLYRILNLSMPFAIRLPALWQNIYNLRNMKPSIALNLHRARIRQIALAHRVTNPRVFGSVARGEDTENSDLDILVDPTQQTSLFDIGAIRVELLNLLGVSVDVVTPNALPEKFRSQVIFEAIAV